MEPEEKSIKTKKIRKITKQRLLNIALYYVQRFETSLQNLRDVLRRRVKDYAFYNPDFNSSEAEGWIEEILSDFQKRNYVNDSRFAELKIRDYLALGKSENYIRLKMAQKGIDDDLVEAVLAEQEFDPFQNALKLAKKKRIGPFRALEMRSEFRKKDMAVLARAGFDYDVVKKVMDFDPEE